MKLTITIRKDSEGGFEAFVNELPSTKVHGKTWNEARERLVEALELVDTVLEKDILVDKIRNYSGSWLNKILLKVAIYFHPHPKNQHSV